VAAAVAVEPEERHRPSTEDRVANALGEAFIPVPDVSAVPGEGAGGPVVSSEAPTQPVPAVFPEDVVPPPPETPMAPEPAAVVAPETPPVVVPDPAPVVQAPAPPAIPEPEPPTAAVDEPEPEPATPAPVESDGPVLTVEPGGAVETPAEPARRVSRPFSLPKDLPRPEAPPAAAPPRRPTAPVFRPTPGTPVQPVQAAPPSPSTPAPAPPSAPSPAAEVPARPVNPFLSRDPRQKARRLARALISDMIVYQPEKRQRALDEGNLPEAFEEEIRKSWEEYVDQVGEEIANSTSHFNDALNDILAGGRPVF